jgi:uncharacterized membrane protein YraQ (UPF0718 family)
MQELLTEMIMTVIGSLIHNWIPLSLAMLVAAIMKVYVDQEKLKTALLRKNNISIWVSVAVGAFTPLCACGTMAVILGILTTSMPWGPIMAFLTSSPLMSPDGFIMTAGIINLKFAIALTLASIVIGLGSGYLTHLIEKKTDFLKNQTRFLEKPQVQTCSCSDSSPVLHWACCDAQMGFSEPAGSNISQSACTSTCNQAVKINKGTNVLSRIYKKIKWKELAEAFMTIGVKQILLFYSIFVAVGFLINSFVPASMIVALFSAENIFAVPLAALIGLPLYVSGESSIPLIKALMEGGAGGGSMLAFLITGAGTSAWVVAGIATFMKRRIIGLYVFFLLAGGIISGYLFDLFLVTGI